MAGEAPDYGSMIGDILGNPEAMEGVMQVAKAMGLGSAFGASGETGSNDSNDRNAPSVSSGRNRFEPCLERCDKCVRRTEREHR